MSLLSEENRVDTRLANGRHAEQSNNAQANDNRVSTIVRDDLSWDNLTVRSLGPVDRSWTKVKQTKRL